MKINITKEQYKMLAKMAMVASDVYGILGDNVSDEYKKESDKFEEFRKYILECAKDFDCEEFTEEYKGKIIPSDDFSEKMQIVTDEYDDETFWHELETRLGKRDFERDMTKEERKQTEKDGYYPDRIWGYYEKYQKEFEENGVERLEVIEKKNINKEIADKNIIDDKDIDEILDGGKVRWDFESLKKGGVDWLTRLLFRITPLYGIKHLSRKLGMNPDVADKAHDIFAGVERVDIVPSASGSRGFQLILDKSTALYFYQDSDHFVYDGFEVGEYEGGDVTMFD